MKKLINREIEHEGFYRRTSPFSFLRVNIFCGAVRVDRGEKYACTRVSTRCQLTGSVVIKWVRRTRSRLQSLRRSAISSRGYFKVKENCFRVNRTRENIVINVLFEKCSYRNKIRYFSGDKVWNWYNVWIFCLVWILLFWRYLSIIRRLSRDVRYE